uniref:50S ribosomal protein L13 n=1 Tax=Ignisphaera aggregans TaxID=334771 RepID=A0A7C2VDD7_9CREN
MSRSPNTIVVTLEHLENLQLPAEISKEVLVSKEVILDADNAVLGRLASVTANLAKLGFKVHVVNVEKAVVTGDKKMVVDSYKLLFDVKTHKNPYKHAIHRPRHPINIFKRAVRNMLSKDSWLRIQLLKRVKAYLGIPEQFKSRHIIKILDCDASYLGRRKVVSVATIARELGWRGA